VTAASLATPAEVEAALAGIEARLAGYRRDVEELEAEGLDTARAWELVRGVEAQLALLRERKERLLASGTQVE
jgi:hypothetical protein